LKFEKETDIIRISIDHQTEPIEDTPLFAKMGRKQAILTWMPLIY